MGKKRYKDFDAMFAQMNQEYVTIKVFGKEYKIKAQIPAAIPLELSRYDDDNPVPAKKMFIFTEMIFGKKALDEWAKHPDFSSEMLNMVLQETMGMINGEEEDEPEEVTEDDGGVIPKK